VIVSRAVFDKDAPSSKRVFDELADEKTRASLLKYALWRAKTESDAQDLVADAIECACDPDRKPWDPAKRSFFRHMRFVMDDIAIERARTGYGRFEEVGSDIEFDQVLVDPRPLADEALDAARTPDRLRRLGERLRDRVKDTDPLAAKVLDACGLGLETVEAQASHAGCTEKEAYEAFRRLVYHGAKIVEQEAEARARRMKEARPTAKEKGGA